MFENLTITSKNSNKEAGEERVEEVVRPRFNFEDIANLEDSLYSLISELKADFLEGSYDVFISDETGARITALILRGIYKKVNPHSDLALNFVSGGGSVSYAKQSVLENKLEYLEKVTKNKQKGLLITQYIYTGRSINILARLIKRAGLEDFDVAALDVDDEDYNLINLRDTLQGNKIIIGGNEGHRHFHGGEHHSYTGVDNDRNRIVAHPVLQQGLNENVKMARQDVQLMVDLIYDRVFGAEIR